MKPNKQFRGSPYPGAAGGKRKTPQAGLSPISTREQSRQVAEIKRSMVREFGTAISGHGQVLKSALNEAEALAWQTPFPHLFFPVLAEEKASEVSRWAARQRSVRRASRQMSLSA